jgi:hypothetical protein
MASLGYVPNAVARSMRTNLTRTIGCLVPDLVNFPNAAIAQHAERHFAAAGYSLLLANSDYEPAAEIRALEALTAQRVDGLMLYVSDEADPALSRPSPGCPCPASCSTAACPARPTGCSRTTAPRCARPCATSSASATSAWPSWSRPCAFARSTSASRASGRRPQRTASSPACSRSSRCRPATRAPARRPGAARRRRPADRRHRRRQPSGPGPARRRPHPGPRDPERPLRHRPRCRRHRHRHHARAHHRRPRLCRDRSPRRQPPARPPGRARCPTPPPRARQRGRAARLLRPAPPLSHSRALGGARRSD